MRPDRFGKSPNHEFWESRGREREHAFETLIVFPNARAAMTLQGFCGWAPDSLSFPESIDPSAVVWRRAVITETSTLVNNAGTRSFTFEFQSPIGLRNDPDFNYPRLIDSSGSFTNAQRDNIISQIRGGGNTYARTSRQIVATDSIGRTIFTQTVELSGETHWADWDPILRDKFRALTDFGRNWFLQPDPNSSGEYVLVDIGPIAPGADYSSAAVTKDDGTFIIVPSPPLIFDLRFGGMGDALTKVLLPSVVNQFSEWVVRKPDSAPPPSELSCGLQGGVEVLDPPIVGEAQLEFGLSRNFGFYRFAFPISARPPVSLVGNLIPTCDPTFS